MDLNHRPRPYQGSVVRFYNNLQDRGDCQTTRKSHKTSHFVGWVVGWKKSTNSETTPHSFPRTSFWIVFELPIIRELLHLMDTRAFLVTYLVRLPQVVWGAKREDRSATTSSVLCRASRTHAASTASRFTELSVAACWAVATGYLPDVEPGKKC